jgi:HEPN domain-containing protein
MTRHELAVRLLAKATQDEVAVDRLIHDVSVADEVVGFHLQQAAEKLLKSVLAQHGIDVRETHNLVYLMYLLGDCDVSFPAQLRALQSLNPFAVEYRYDLLDDEVLPPLSRAELRGLVRDLRAWAETQVG